MLLQESRRAARTSGDGNLILLEQRNLAPVRGCRGGTLGVNGRNVRLQSVGTEAARSKSTFGKRDAFGDLVPVRGSPNHGSPVPWCHLRLRPVAELLPTEPPRRQEIAESVRAAGGPD